MRSNPADYDMIAPGSLQAVVSLLAREPGQWLPIAGGTDVMVQYAMGKLPSRKLVSIWNLPELRQIEILQDEIQIGAGCTYTDLRKHPVVTAEFPLLASAAGWTGGIANQNRGTLGGNIVNASPAADSLPALLVYEAELILISDRGQHRLPYLVFHTGYKKMQLAPDELIRAVCLRRRYSEHFSYTRKVGARNAQAISKVCIAALGRLAGGKVEDVRIALGSVAPVPIRLAKTEAAIRGKLIDPSLVALAKEAAVGEIRPIDDVRSTTAYRTAVAGNLVAEFLGKLREATTSGVLARWNCLPANEAENEILPCCGSSAWAHGMAGRRPIADETSLLNASGEVWRNLAESDWVEAFGSHPRIGESKTGLSAPRQAASWSEDEQRSVSEADETVKMALAQMNREYEQRFGQIFIVCAAGKSPGEILQILQRRLQNNQETELGEAAEQQEQIMLLRLQKWLKR